MGLPTCDPWIMRRLKVRTVFVLVLALTIFIPQQSSAQDGLDVKTLRSMCSSEIRSDNDACILYIGGFYDGFLMGSTSLDSTLKALRLTGHLSSPVGDAIERDPPPSFRAYQILTARNPRAGDFIKFTMEFIKQQRWNDASEAATVMYESLKSYADSLNR
jgi:hypothetical protein